MHIPHSVSSTPPSPSIICSFDPNTPEFVPRRYPLTKVIIKSQDGTEATLDAHKNHSPQQHTVSIPPTSPVVSNWRTTSIRTESQEVRRMREGALWKEQEAKRIRDDALWKEQEAKCMRDDALLREQEANCMRDDAFWREQEAKRMRDDALWKEQEAKRIHDDALRREQEAKCMRENALWKEQEAKRMRDNALWKEQDAKRMHENALRISSLSSTPSAGLEPVAPLDLSANRRVTTSAVRKVQPDTDNLAIVDREVKALLSNLTMERFDSISDQIIQWANKSVNEMDGHTLFRVTQLVFESAIDNAALNEVHARLCRKIMEQISPDVQDDGIKNQPGRPIAGGKLFRKYLLARCQEGFERGCFAKEAVAATNASDDRATKAVNEKKGMEVELYSDEYYAAQKAKRQGLSLVKFLGELFKLQILTERIMHECMKKLLGNAENPEEEEIESLCQLLKTVGQLLDTQKARAHMDVYFIRMKELGKNTNVSSRMQFMLQDVIELRERKWVSYYPYDNRCCS